MSDNILGSCQTSSIVLEAPAKINLGLSIVGRREDGYHELQSLFWPINWYDRLHIGSSPTIEVTANWAPEAPFKDIPLPQEKSNLVYTAIEATKKTLSVTIEKCIPMGGGLGGGSSNAGAVLRYMVSNSPLTQTQAQSIAARLGADVPFFLSPQPTFIGGIGEKRSPCRIDPILADSLLFFLVFLPRPTSTQSIFQAYAKRRPKFSPTRKQPTEQLDLSTFTQYLSEIKNDLEADAISSYPLIGTVLSSLRSVNCLYAGVSGSGSTCVAVCLEPRRKELKVLTETFRTEGCKTVIAKTHFEQ